MRIIRSYILVTPLALLAGQGAWAQSTWEVQAINNGFRVSRSSSSGTETVRYRTVSLSAMSGKHFLGSVGSLTFEEGQISKTVTVSTQSPGDDQLPYKFQEGTTRSFRFEVLDAGERNVLATCTKVLSYGLSYRVRDTYINSSITNLVTFDSNGNYSSGLPSGKYLDDVYNPSTNEYLTVTETGYGQSDAIDFDIYSFIYSNVCQSPKHLHNIGDKVYATACFTMKEEDDGYQYIQIHTGSSYDGNDPDGSVNDPENSVYKACFELSKTNPKIVTDDHKWFFPHRLDYYNNDNPHLQEFDYGDSYLYRQKFKDSYRAPNSGSLVLDPETAALHIRFDAAGEGSDTWYFKNLFVRFAVLDDSAPAVLNEVTTASAFHYRGTPETITIPFNEIVRVTGTPTITTSWGTFTYEAGSGTNVLSFSGTINASPGTALSVTGLTGTVKDMAGNAFTWSGTQTLTATVGTSNTVADLDMDPQGRYLINTKEQLIALANDTNSGAINTSGMSFLQTDNFTFQDSGEDGNYTPIGNATNRFKGTYDGGGHTISGIRTTTGYYRGIFGYVDGGTIQNLALSNSSIHGEIYLGGIVGYNLGGTIQNCCVDGSVSIRPVNGGSCGGIVGYNDNGHIIGCLSGALFSQYKSNSIGGLVGAFSGGTLKDCLYTGNSVTGSREYGALIGFIGVSTSNNYANNYYTAYTAVAMGAIGDFGNNMHDADGARRARVITLGTSVGIVGDATTYGVSGITAIGNNVICYGNTYYSGETQTVTLSYSGNVPTGHEVVYSATGGTINGNSLTMPDEDVTVTAAVVPIVPVLTGHLSEGFYWATYYNSSLRYTLPAGAQAYTLGTDHQLYRLGTDGRTIPANQAVVIISDKQNITLTLSTDNATITDHAPGGNQLLGSNSPVAVSGLSGTPHVLGEVGSTIGFYPYTGTSIPANKAYYVTTP